VSRPSKKASIPYQLPSPTNKRNSDSSPKASSNTFHISYHLTSYNLPVDNPNPKWEDWNGPLTSDIEDIISTFLASLLNKQSIPPSAILISQLGLASDGLGLLCPLTRAAPDIITMTTTTHNAKHGFSLHQDLLLFKLHQTLSNLFPPTINTHLPHSTTIPTSPPKNRIHRLRTIYPNY
jgi:hypothetical protein